MKRILFEGTDQQIENLKNLLAYGGNNLPKEVTNAFLGKLWSNEDVTCKYQCSDEQAQEILADALSNEATMEQIWLAIDVAADDILGSMVTFYDLSKKNSTLEEAKETAKSTDWSEVESHSRLISIEHLQYVSNEDGIEIYYEMDSDQFMFAKSSD